MPRFEVTSPEGKKYEVMGPDGSTQEDAIAQVQRQLQSPAPQEAKPKTILDHVIGTHGLGTGLAPVAEPVASLLTGTAGQALGGLAGGVASMIPGLRPGIGADVSAKIADAMTYQPRTEGGKTVLSTIGKPFEWLAGKARQAGEATQDATGSAGLATAVDTGIQALPMAAGGLISRLGASGESAASIAARNKAKVQNAPKDAAIENARNAGLSISPEDANAGIVPRAIAGLAGEPKLQKVLSKKNAPVMADMVKEDVGLSADTPLTRKALADIRAEAGDAYEAVKSTGTIRTSPEYHAALNEITKSYDTAARDFPHRSENPFQKTMEGLKRDRFDATSAVEEVKLLRSDADEAFRAGKSGLGRAFKSASKALDDEIARHVEGLAAGNPAMKNVATDYLAARERIAKTYAADKALNDANGTVDAAVYARELKRGKPLSGAGRDIAEFATAFPRAAQKVERTGSTGPTYFDLLGAVAGKDALLLGARPLARQALATDIVQKLIAKPGNYERSGLSVAKDEAVKKAGLLAAIGASSSRK